MQLWVCTLVWRIPAQRTKVHPTLLKTCLFHSLVFLLLLCRHLVWVDANSIEVALLLVSRFLPVPIVELRCFLLLGFDESQRGSLRRFMSLVSRDSAIHCLFWRLFCLSRQVDGLAVSQPPLRPAFLIGRGEVRKSQLAAAHILFFVILPGL